MNTDITPYVPGKSEFPEASGNTHITDFTQVVSCAIGRDPHEQQRQKIREELVREHFSEESPSSLASSSLRNRLLKLLRLG